MFAVLGLALLLCVVPGGFATDAGSLTGTVVDPSGAAIPGALVKLINPATGNAQSASTSIEGAYKFLAIAAGHYQITIEAPGFKPYVAPDVIINPEALRLEARLEVSSRETTTVEVAVSSLLVDTTNTQIGVAISGEKMTDVPLNGRGFTDLLALQPGGDSDQLATAQCGHHVGMHKHLAFRRSESRKHVG